MDFIIGSVVIVGGLFGLPLVIAERDIHLERSGRIKAFLICWLLSVLSGLALWWMDSTYSVAMSGWQDVPTLIKFIFAVAVLAVIFSYIVAWVAIPDYSVSGGGHVDEEGNTLWPEDRR